LDVAAVAAELVNTQWYGDGWRAHVNVLSCITWDEWRLAEALCGALFAAALPLLLPLAFLRDMAINSECCCAVKLELRSFGA
jgi:hypothetical protein